MESQPQNPEFRFNPENFHQCGTHKMLFRIIAREDPDQIASAETV